MKKLSLAWAFGVLAATLGAGHAVAQVNVTTWHNDNWRTGQNTNETTLTTSTVQHNFGLLCKISLLSSPQQEQAYAQPLVVSNSNGMTVYVATMQDNVYVFNVPTTWTSQTCSLLQSTSPIPLLRGPIAGQHPADVCRIGNGTGTSDCSTDNNLVLCPSVGVLGTPTIDVASNTLYLVTESQDANTDPEGKSCQGKPTPNFYHYLHALDLTSPTLAETNGGPVLISPPNQGHAVFDSKKLLQRPGLLFLKSSPTPVSPTVYTAFSMMDGTRPNPSGWVLAYDGGSPDTGRISVDFCHCPEL